MRLWAQSLAMALSVGILGAAFSQTPVGTAFEAQVGLSVLFRIRGPVDPPPKVVIVGLDKRSSARLDLPPQPVQWPRSLHARLIDQLVQRGAAVIVFDLYFERAREPAEDDAFAAAIRRSGRVLLCKSFERSWRDGVQVDSIRMPLPLFAHAALGVAPFVLPTVPARVHRFTAFLTGMPTLPTAAAMALSQSAGTDWPALIERAVLPQSAAAGGDPPGSMNLIERAQRLRAAILADPDFEARLRQAASMPPLDALAGQTPAGSAAGRLLDSLLDVFSGRDTRYLNFYGPPGTIRTLSYYEVVDPEAWAQASRTLDLDGAAVFVGSSERDLPNKFDGFDTVFSRADGVGLSGVEIAATAFANIAGDRILHPAGRLPTFLLLLALPLMVSALLLHVQSIRWALAACLAVAAAYLVAAQVVFEHASLWLPVATPLMIQVPLATLAGLGLIVLHARQERRQIAAALRLFVPERVVREIADRRQEPFTYGATRYAVCLYMDAENFVGTAEDMAPAAAAQMLNAYFDRLAAPLQRSRVSFKEFTADSVIFAWVARRPGRALRRRACEAALQILAANESFTAQTGIRRLSARMGLHAGPVYIGSVGAGDRFAYRMVGDTVNTASRIEGLNKLMGTRLLASEAAVEGVANLLLRPLGRFQLRGRQGETRIVEIVGGKGAETGQLTLLAGFDDGLRAFLDGRLDAAAMRFERLAQDYPGDGPINFYHTYCQDQAQFGLQDQPQSAMPASETDPTVIRVRQK